ncbi:TPA: hypothetical protein JBL19_16330 [Legionella pneumophila]|nr:hypothetical protein [Legionella pneumophila]HAT1887434.1 hypothetical protein [Legionella pneumophila]HAT3984171.1 hypothetical protein [Legionella pneumophila]HAT7749243.1 hypothetical protein [Legionella pneumophila]HAT7797840.1 hypothetical protein [Legionella pneumophila]
MDIQEEKSDILDEIEKSGKFQDEFSKEFLRKYLESGFGSLSKHDIDLLIYHLITQKTVLLKDKTIYEQSNLLRLTELKIKNIQLEAYLKYESKNSITNLNEVIDKVESGAIKPEIENGRIRFLLDSPILKREIENCIKLLGHVVDYSFNKDVVSIKIVPFISAIKSIQKEKGDELEAKITQELRSQFKDEQKKAGEIEAMTISELLKKIGTNLSSSVLKTVTTSMFTYLSQTAYQHLT